MELTQIVSDEPRLLTVGEKFKTLVTSRNYKEAKKYFNSLGSEEQYYIQRNKDYYSWLKVLKFTSI